MAQTKKVRVAVVGAGHVAQVAHIPAYRKNPDAELVAVVDDDPVKARRIRAQAGFAEWYEDIADMLKRADVDAVDICTPNYLHAPMAIAALRAGKDVLCEKPLARSANEAQKMADAAQKYGRILMVAMNNRFREDVEDSAAAMVRFAGGASLMLEVNWNLREKRDVVYVQIYGSKGAAMLNPLAIHKSIHGVLVNVTPAIDKRNYYQHSYQAEIDHFVACVGKKRKPRTSGAEAIGVLRILDAMYASAESGREVEIGR